MTTDTPNDNSFEKQETILSSPPIELNEKCILTKELYDLVVGQQVIPFKEEAWFELTSKSEWKAIFLHFKYRKTEFMLRKQIRVRLSKLSKNPVIGEERYIVCRPEKMKVPEIQKWITEITLRIYKSNEKQAVLNQEGEKVCMTCKLPRPFSEFQFHHSNADRLSSDCKSCMSIKSKEARDLKNKRLFEKTHPTVDGKPSVPPLTDQQKQEAKKEFDRNNLIKFLNL